MLHLYYFKRLYLHLHEFKVFLQDSKDKVTTFPHYLQKHLFEIHTNYPRDLLEIVVVREQSVSEYTSVDQE